VRFARPVGIGVEVAMRTRRRAWWRVGVAGVACLAMAGLAVSGAAADTLCILREEGAERVGGVMHCFTETEAVADQAMALNFYISFSGIVTFKNARELKDVAMAVPLERMLIETDSPYLAPVPYRGRTNEPAFVRHVAEEIASLRGIDVAEVGAATTRNFFELFRAAQAWR
ncbi:MAG: TatD family hydrolase, partial [Sulfurimicrobium sp.]